MEEWGKKRKKGLIDMTLVLSGGGDVMLQGGGVVRAVSWFVLGCDERFMGC